MISYQEFMAENALRQPEDQSSPVTTGYPGLYVAATAPTGATENSLWYKTSLDNSRLYIKYDNNWIGIS